MTGVHLIRPGGSKTDSLVTDRKLQTLGAMSRGFLDAESLLQLHALEAAIDQALADVHSCGFALRGKLFSIATRQRD